MLIRCQTGVRAVRRIRAKARGCAGGMTLIELLIALAIAMIVLGAVTTFTGSTQKAWDTVSQDCSANFDLRRAAERVADELRQSALSRVTVDHTGMDGDVVTFQIPVGKVQGVVLWGAEGNSGWYLMYTVENGQLIRRILNNLKVKAGMDMVLTTHLDGNTGGQKGFWVNLNGTMADIGVRAAVHSTGETWRKQARTSVLFRNE